MLLLIHWQMAVLWDCTMALSLVKEFALVYNYSLLELLKGVKVVMKAKCLASKME